MTWVDGLLGILWALGFGYYIGASVKTAECADMVVSGKSPDWWKVSLFKAQLRKAGKSHASQTQAATPSPHDPSDSSSDPSHRSL